MTLSTFQSKVLGKGLLAGVSSILVLSVMLIGASVVLAAPPVNNIAVNLDQCRNGGLVTSGDQTFNKCTGSGSGSSGWVNGNAGASNAHYAEGESISYRARLTNLKNNDQVTLILGYDVIHNGHDALDYLTDKNRWQTPETTVAATPDDPCSGVSGCSGNPQLLPIPAPTHNINADPSLALANGCQGGSTGSSQPVTSYNAVNGAGQENMEFFGATPGTFNYTGPIPNLLDKSGDEEQQVTLTFTATSANPVIAWGAHIASRLDWGCLGAPQSASGISGSPYHMRIKSAIVNGTVISLGNQDRSLSAAAVVFVNPGITTLLSAASGNVPTTAHDSATLTGALSTAGGTVTYTVYSNNTCTIKATTGTTGQIDRQPGSADGTLDTPGTVTVTNGVVPDSGNVTFQQSGTYYWQAAYSGDGHNAPATSLCTDESITISKTTPDVSTAQNLVPNDTFTLSNFGGTPSGTVDFYLFGPSSGPCSEANEGSALTTLNNMTGRTLSSAGVASTANTVAVSDVGTYTWLAVWAGDNANNKTVSNCVETFTINNG